MFEMIVKIAEIAVRTVGIVIKVIEMTEKSKTLKSNRPSHR